ncbi:alpha/beta-hydrolase [Lepidopterella palustris CBS 459.81]|uniref:Alpha/beta-hydrolase n=1 Tax=Lepidopterella palustris CBS 459.81 TaxID=1314670 RepID=A0A8E2EIG5_9PEZI|nr:alpha/beta-hydrolase [Lepidopterella palustris CBS 459.81]
MPFFQHSDVSLFYTDEGAGQPLLLLHGFGSDSHDWSFQIPALLSASYRVIAFDHRGHGRSTNPPTASPTSYHPNTLAADAIALLQHLSIPSIVLVAHSLSTIISSLITVTQPSLVKALVLIHPIYGATPPVLKSLATDLRADLPNAPQLAADFFGKVSPRTPEWIQTWARRRMLGTAPECVAGCLEGLVALEGQVTGQGEGAKSFLRRRAAPRFVVSGIDVAVEWEREIGIKEGIDELHVVREGTYLHLVEGETVNGLLVGWLGRTVRDLIHGFHLEMEVNCGVGYGREFIEVVGWLLVGSNNLLWPEEGPDIIDLLADKGCPVATPPYPEIRS